MLLSETFFFFFSKGLNIANWIGILHTVERCGNTHKLPAKLCSGILSVSQIFILSYLCQL